MSPEVRFHQAETKQLTYTLDFDVDAYKKNRGLYLADPEAYHQQKEALDGTTTFNLITTLAERLNAALSRRTDIIGRDGIMRDSHQGKPLIEWYEKGRLARLEQGSSPHDQLREEAEIIGQAYIQSFFAEAPVGSFAYSVSRPGNEELPQHIPHHERSIYGHNFIDLFQKTGEEEITVMRCMSNLSKADVLKKIRQLNPESDFPSDVTDVELLATPQTLYPEEVPFKTVDELHTFFHNHVAESLSEEEFEIVKKTCMPYIKRYLLVVENVSHVSDTLKRAFNAILNKADEVVARIKEGRMGSVRLYQSDSEGIATEEDMYLLGSMEVRSVDTGCGFSGGFAVGEGNNSPFGVLDAVGGFYFNQERDQYGSLHFDCPSCKRTNKRPSGVLIPTCQYCMADVSCKDKKEDSKKTKEMEDEERKEKAQREEEEKRLLEEKAKKKGAKRDGFLETIIFMMERQSNKDEKLAA